MTWAFAKSDGEARGEIILARLRDARAPRGTSISLVDYETEEDYDFLRIGDLWSHGYQKMVLRAVKRVLRKAGYKVELRILCMADYFAWLTDQKLKNSTENRALFVGLEK